MKNIVKIIITTVLIIPCLFVSACGPKDISLNEYSTLVKGAGDNFVTDYSNYDKLKDITITLKNDKIENVKQEIEYKETESSESLVTKKYDKKITTNKIQTISFDRQDGQNAPLNAKVVQTETVVEEGYRANATTQLLEQYTKKSEDVREIYFIALEDTYFQYALHTDKDFENNELINDNVVSRQKYVYSYKTDYESDLKNLLSNVYSKYINDFFNTGMLILLPNATCYTEGNTFGLKYSMYSTMSSSSTSTGLVVSSENTDSSVLFVNNLPSMYVENKLTNAVDTSVSDNKSVVLDYNASVTSGVAEANDAYYKYSYALWS
ncbi:MAG: hypothetical protein IJW28_04235 [Clostridia bacterium]|nr:hypothetical protein [Clostridia bacterium]